jgi:hypothetical protein
VSARWLGVLHHRHQSIPHLGRELTGTEGLGQEVVDSTNANRAVTWIPTAGKKLSVREANM